MDRVTITTALQYYLDVPPDQGAQNSRQVIHFFPSVEYSGLCPMKIDPYMR